MLQTTWPRYRRRAPLPRLTDEQPGDPPSGSEPAGESLTSGGSVLVPTAGRPSSGRVTAASGRASTPRAEVSRRGQVSGIHVVVGAPTPAGREVRRCQVQPPEKIRPFHADCGVATTGAAAAAVVWQALGELTDHKEEGHGGVQAFRRHQRSDWCRGGSSSRMVASPSDRELDGVDPLDHIRHHERHHHNVRIGATFCRFHERVVGRQPGAEPLPRSSHGNCRFGGTKLARGMNHPPIAQPGPRLVPGRPHTGVVLGQAPLPDDREDGRWESYKSGREQEREPEEGVGVVDKKETPFPASTSSSTLRHRPTPGPGARGPLP